MPKVENQKPKTKDENDMRQKLYATLCEKPKSTPKPFHFNISKTISVDSYVLNFGTFYPEKLLGSILIVQNITDHDQIVELSIDSKTQIYDTERICNQNSEFKYLKEVIDEQQQKIEKEEPPAKDDVVVYEKFLHKKAKKLRKNGLIVNSETCHDCWFIENPSSKDLTKKIT